MVHTIQLGFLKPRRLAPPRFLILAISGYAAKGAYNVPEGDLTKG